MDKLLKEMEQNAYTQTIYTISGTLMIVIGIFFLIGAIKKNQKEEQSVPLGKFMTNFCSAFFVSLFNPKNIVAFSAVIISFGGLTQHGNITVSTALLFGLGTTISVAIMFSTLIYLSVSAANKYLYSVLPILKYFVAFMFFTIGIIRLVTV